MKTFTDSTLMPFGKHKGMPLGEVPEGYLRWLGAQDWMYEQRELGEYIEAKLQAAKVQAPVKRQPSTTKSRGPRMTSSFKDFLKTLDQAEPGPTGGK